MISLRHVVLIFSVYLLTFSFYSIFVMSDDNDQDKDGSYNVKLSDASGNLGETDLQDFMVEVARFLALENPCPVDPELARYENHIPLSKYSDSELWRCLSRFTNFSKKKVSQLYLV